MAACDIKCELVDVSEDLLKGVHMASKINRRNWIKSSGAAVALTTVVKLGENLLFGQQAAAESDLIVRSMAPLNAEPALSKLSANWITPNSAFFIRCHAAAPKVDEKLFSLNIEGLVERPTTFSLSQLKERFKDTKVTATLTCAGNRRNEFSKVKKVGGVQWDAGAIGNAEWSGIRLSELLRAVGIKSDAAHVWFEGKDQITEKGETFPFGGSIPLAKALSDTESSPCCLLAHSMNGQPLPLDHGFPLRAIVPGYIGARSVKWLSKITVSDRPSPNHYLAHAYKVIGEDTPAAIDLAAPIYEFVVNSIICSPTSGDTVRGDHIEVNGVALPDGQTGVRLKRVEVSADGGQTWQKAQFTSPLRDFCWVQWKAQVPLTAQTESLLVRAVDSSETVQPRETPWNVKGYQYNGWHQVNLKRT